MRIPRRALTLPNLCPDPGFLSTATGFLQINDHLSYIHTIIYNIDFALVALISCFVVAGFPVSGFLVLWSFGD